MNQAKNQAERGSDVDRFSLRALFALAPLNGDHFVGLRAGIGVMLPLLFLIAIDRLDLAPYVVFGSFVGVYSRAPMHLDRLLVQIKAAGLMWIVVLLAWLSGDRLIHGAQDANGQWWLVACTSVVSALAALAVGLLRVRPAGSLFHVFAFAVVASIQDAPRLGDAMFAATATMVFSLIVGQLGRILPKYRTPWQVTVSTPMPAHVKRAVFQELPAYFVAPALAGSLATLLAGPLGMGHVYWAMVAAVVPLVGQSTMHRVIRGVHRVIGTVAGLVVMALIVALQPQPWLAIVLIGLTQFLAEYFVVRNYFWAMVFITPLALVGSTLGHVLTWHVLYDRAIETGIGVVIGMAVVEGMAWCGRRILAYREGNAA
ncbi:FUSC family protein [Galactobacter sp.]|uniref:FUSC family protein n=1 Tax=Galactobacter sp. TaxID=2676125 RepID=UPI0025B88B07|nr:FUSC family protein [Galactobacter sp.]